MGLNEVVLVFGDLILRGCRSVKTDANSYRAFQAPGLSPLGTIGTQIDVDWERAMRPASGDFQLQTVMDQRVMTVPLFPGLDAARVYDSVLASDSHHRPRAVVLKAFGVGNIPQVGFLPLVQALSEAEIPVIVGRQCLRGHTDLELVPGGRAPVGCGRDRRSGHDLRVPSSPKRCGVFLKRTKTSPIGLHRTSPEKST